ncbi:CHAP domain-containing protein [Actinokineospora sp.]|uniref:CHAP domain-containing protein n=1 Tax=Actinokineospora sp. TaxID=1872133 RepID=UPI0040381E3E
MTTALTSRVRAVLAMVVCATVGVVGLAGPAQAAGPITVHVAHTEGQPLMVRSGPGTGYGIIGQLGYDDYVQITCQKSGETIHGNAYWDYIPAYGGYASDHYLYTSLGNGRLTSLPLCGTSTGVRDRIVSLARGEVGGTDKSRYGSPWNHEWCQYFVNWVWRQAGVPGMNASGFTGDLYWWGRDRGLTRDGRSGIRPGDAVLFGTGPANPSTSMHVGIVVTVHADGRITTVDGNYWRNGVSQVATVGPFHPGSPNGMEPGPVYAVVSPPGA